MLQSNHRSARREYVPARLDSGSKAEHDDRLLVRPATGLLENHMPAVALWLPRYSEGRGPSDFDDGRLAWRACSLVLPLPLFPVPFGRRADAQRACELLQDLIHATTHEVFLEDIERAGGKEHVVHWMVETCCQW